MIGAVGACRLDLRRNLRRLGDARLGAQLLHLDLLERLGVRAAAHLRDLDVRPRRRVVAHVRADAERHVEKDEEEDSKKRRDEQRVRVQ